MRLKTPNPVILIVMITLGIGLHLATEWPPLIGWSVGCVIGACLEFKGLDF